MSKKKDKSPKVQARSPGPTMAKKMAEKPYRFFNHLEFAWDQSACHWNATGPGLPENNPMHWFVGVLTLHCRFHHSLYEEFGSISSWQTTKDAERSIEYCRTYPVFSVDPDAMFLRRWLDTWVELHYCTIWRHVFDHVRRRPGAKEADAEKQANRIGNAYYATFEPCLSG
jgi:hypothetical protein